MTRQACIFAVVLTYNSLGELSICLAGLKQQTDVDLRVVVVDNASTPEAVPQLIEEFLGGFPDGAVVARADLESAPQEAPALFIKNDQNTGYSAGNNIGARHAARLGCDAVLIVNPDMEIDDPRYVQTLWQEMQADPTCQVIASRILGVDGADQNALREAGFWEELLWIRQFGPRFLRPKSFVTKPTGPAPMQAEKLSGCCQMIRTAFLEEIGFLDETVFLYCEEPILAAQVHAKGGRLLVLPDIVAVHAHIASKKANASRRMLNFIQSRRYYIDRYSGYGPLRRAALHLSYRLLHAVHALRARRAQ